MQFVKAGKVLHIVLAVLIVLFMCGHFLLNDVQKQQESARHIERIISSALGTNATAGRVQFVYPFGITIDSLTVYDLKDDTLAYVSSITLRFKPLELLKRRLSITSAVVKNPDIRLNADSLGAVPNYAFLSELSGNSQGSMSLRANSILIRGGSASYDILDAPMTDSLFNPSHIAVDDLSASVSLKAMESDSLAFIIRKLTFSEQSGFKLSKTKGAVSIGADSTIIRDLRLSTPNSDFIADRISVSSSKNGIPAFAASFGASVTGRDFMAFEPRLSGMTDRIDLSFSGHGDNEGIEIEALSLQSENREMDIAGKGTVVLDGRKISGVTNAGAYGNLNAGFTAWAEDRLGSFGLSVPKVLRSLGQTSFDVGCNWLGKDLESSATVISGVGTAQYSISGTDGRYKGAVRGRSIRLRPITGNRDLGNCNFDLHSDMALNSEGLCGTFNGTVGDIVYKKYAYEDVHVSGSFKPGFISSDLKFSDRNGALALDASISNGNVRNLTARLEADNLNLAAYGLAGQDSMSVSARLTADLAGKDIDDISGRIVIDSLSYGDAIDGWYMENLTADISNEKNSNSISVIGDFINLSLAGNYRLSTLPLSLSKACADILPTIGRIVDEKTGISSRKRHDNSFTVDGRLENTDFMSKVFHKPVVLNRPATIHLAVLDKEDKCNGTISVPAIRVADEILYDGLITLNSEDGACRAEISGLYGENGPRQTSLKASALAFDDIVRTRYFWNNQAGDVSGSAKTLSQFSGYDRKSGLKSMSVLDSTDITVNGAPWKIAQTVIRSDSGKVNISGLKIGNGAQYLYADGVISPDSSDILKIAMSRIDLDRTLTMFHANGAQLKGTASGELNLTGVTGRTAFYGQFEVEDFDFLNSYHGHLDADCRWNGELQRIDINGNMLNGSVETTMLNGYYEPGRNYLDMGIEANHTDLHFLNRWTSNVFREIGGRALGSLNLFGPLDSLDLAGQAVLENGFFIQDAVNTVFLVKNDTLWFEPGRMLFKNVEFYDEKDHDGLMTCILTHDCFKNWRVDMTADVADMQVFNTQKTETNSFYATIFAEGSMALKFDNEKGLAISVDARTAPGTRIGYNPTSGSVADYNFLTIVDRDTISINEDAVTMVLPDTRRKSGKTSYDFNIECSEDALIDMSFNSLSGLFRGNGNISYMYTPQDGTVLNGIYNLSYGQCTLSFEDIIRKTFALQEGSFVRFNGAPNETEINLYTYHNVNSVSIYDLDPSASSNNNVRVRCLMDITGNVQDPQIKFDIDMPNGTSEEKDILASATATEEQRNNQFLYLLTIGRFYTQDYSGQNAYGMTPSTMESIVNSTVSGQINNLLAQVLDSEHITLSSNVSASSYLSNDASNLSNKELEGILEARLLDNRLLVNGNFGYRENTVTNTSNFIGDVEFKYRLFPRQGISLKGYNKANDKYFSKTTLTTQGVGIVFERDF